MYSTKYVNKNCVEGNKYITIGDPYSGSDRRLPERWKGKQMKVFRDHSDDHKPHYFANYEYKSEIYRETHKYNIGRERKPPAFGSTDAFRSDEFTSNIRTQQYRETLKRESEMYEAQRDREAERSVIESITSQPTTFPEGLRETRHLYDIGRDQETPFNPRSTRDTFYSMRTDREKRWGPSRSTSQEVGQGAWDYNYSPPEFGPKAYVKNFYDRSHLSAEGL